MSVIDGLKATLARAQQPDSPGGELITRKELHKAYRSALVDLDKDGKASELTTDSRRLIASVPTDALRKGGLFRPSAVKYRTRILDRHPSTSPAPGAPVTETTPVGDWDGTARRLVSKHNSTARKRHATSAIGLWTPSGTGASLTTVRSNKYKPTEIVRQVRVSGKGAGDTLPLRLALPISAHTGDSQPADGVLDAEAWAKVDEAIVWVRYVDADKVTPGKDLPSYSQGMPSQDSDDVLILAKGIKAPAGDLTRIVDVRVPLRPGKVAVVMFDGNSNGPGAGVGGFKSGRSVEIFYK